MTYTILFGWMKVNMLDIFSYANCGYNTCGYYLNIFKLEQYACHC